MEKIKIKAMARNLLSNWYFPIGAAAFYCANVQWISETRFVPMGLWIAAALCAIFAAANPSFLAQIQRMHWGIKLFSAITAIGTFWDHMAIPLGGISFRSEAEFLNILLQTYQPPAVVGELAIFAAWLFAFVCVALFTEKLVQIFKDTELCKGIPLLEWAVYGVMLLISVLLFTAAFMKTTIFYGGGGDIFTGDSNIIVPGALYVNLYHSHNDIHQPLFAVFSAPFVGIAYFLGAFVYKWPTAQMLLLNMTQVVLIFVSGFMLAKMLELGPRKRVCFQLLFCCSTMYLLFILMMEQYAVSVFWLILCVYLIYRQKPEPLATIAAGGTMITSLAFVPFAQKNDPRKDFWGWFRGCAQHGIGFLMVMLACCRLDAFAEMNDSVPALIFFTGKVSLWGRVLQFLAFVRNCFLLPGAFIAFPENTGPNWLQLPVTEISITGMILMALVILSLWLNRKKTSSLLCGYWVAFSVAILVIAGWGTMENGLLLYTLYFGWAYFALLFQLVQWVAEKWKLTWLVPIVSVAASAVMLAVNIPAIAAMIEFAATYYPG